MANDEIRSPIISVLGHVDHGKSSFLDAIRGTNIVAKEAGNITQAIGASLIPTETVFETCGPLIKDKESFKVPGLLFIDTPGHAAFTTLRKRGGALADIAVVVVDINEGFKPQTKEVIEILIQSKTPFVVAANKVDLIHGYTQKDKFMLNSIQAQDTQVMSQIETKMYEIVGSLAEFDIQSERFDRVQDYAKQVAIVPVSAMTKAGVPEVLMVLIGLTQKYLESQLEFHLNGPAKGTVLEVKEEKGLGQTIDVILYDGQLEVNDTIVIGGLEKPTVSKVKALLEPAPLSEMRDKKSNFVNIKKVVAATGVKIAANELGDVIAGMPVQSAKDGNTDAIVEEFAHMVEDVLIETQEHGILLKADSIGSLEALEHILKEKEIPIHRASIGNISKKDMTEAESYVQSDQKNAVIIGFNVVVQPDVSIPEGVRVICGEVIYDIIDKLEEWITDAGKKQEAKELDDIPSPAVFEVLPNCIFRQSNPLVCGVEIKAGVLKQQTPLMNAEGKHLAILKTIQENKETIQSAEKGAQVALSIPGVTGGRQINEGDIVYSNLNEEDFLMYKKHKDVLTSDQKDALRQIAEVRRKENPMWGV